VAARAVVMQHKTQRPVQFEITPATRDASPQRMRAYVPGHSPPPMATLALRGT
jgi:hypothetical protein